MKRAHTQSYLKRNVKPVYTDEEVWKAVVNFEGCYEASSHGRIRSIDRVVVYKNSRRYNKKGKVLSISISKLDMTEVVGLSKEGVRKQYKVAALVATAFIGLPPNPDDTVNHKDGNRLNHHPTNMEWLPLKDNMKHAEDNGLLPRGEENGASKLTDDKVREIRRLSAEGSTNQYLADKYGISKWHVVRLVRRTSWKHLM